MQDSPSPPQPRTRGFNLEPPYNQRIPEEYWQELHREGADEPSFTPPITPPPRPPAPPQPKNQLPKMPVLVILGSSLLALLVSLLVNLLPRPQAQVSPPAPIQIPTPAAVSTPIPTPAPVQVPPAPPRVVPKAEPVRGPLDTTGQSMLSGRQYWMTMPDGRNLLVNWQGFVDHACNLPRQRGINNAAYTELATGLTWIWTVPAAGANIPQWIDP